MRIDFVGDDQDFLDVFDDETGAGVTSYSPTRAVLSYPSAGHSYVLTGFGLPTSANASPSGTVTGASFTTNGQLQMTVSQISWSVQLLTSDALIDATPEETVNLLSLQNGITFSAAQALIGLDLTLGQSLGLVSIDGGDLGVPQTIFGSAFADTLIGGTGNDTITGNGGNDIFLVRDVRSETTISAISGGFQITTTGGGTDRVFGVEVFDFLGNQISAANVLSVTGSVIDGDETSETLNGSDNADLILAAAGDDSVNGNDGNDSILGDIGNDTLNGDEGDDVINGGLYSDVLNGGAGNDDIRGNRGNDTIDGGADHDILRGGAKNDSMLGGTGNDTIYGQADNDTLKGGSGDDTLGGGDGNDLMFGNAGDDNLNGGNGEDTLIGGDNNDTLEGKSGSDEIRGGSGNDRAKGGADNDTLEGDSGNDLLFGNLGDDLLLGGTGRDTLIGGDDNDTLEGGSGADEIRGDAGSDVMSGGSEADKFVFRKGHNADVILDFNAAEDMLRLEASLTDGETDVAQILATYGQPTGPTGVVLNFGEGDVIILEGLVYEGLQINIDVF